MLKSNAQLPPGGLQPAEETDDIDFEYLLSVLRRRWRAIFACAVFAFLLSVAYLITAVPLYTAYVKLLIASPEGRSALELSGIQEIDIDNSAVDSLVELLKSESIALQVEAKLGLSDNPIFMNEKSGPIQIFVGWVRGLVKSSINFIDILLSDLFYNAPLVANSETNTETIPPQRLAARKLASQSRLGVARVSRTYVLGISYTSQSPGLAAQIANAYADVYIEDQLESKYQATARASRWLLKRSEELKGQAIAAEEAVEQFRTENNLIATAGSLISDQQLTGISGQLVLARSELTNTKATYDRLKTIVEGGDTDAVVGETLSQSITSDLRSRYLEASKKLAELTNLLGENHARAIRLRNDMFQLQRLMFEELKRYAEVAGNNVEVARARVESLEAELATLVGTANETNRTLVELRELERNAESVRSLYTTFLQRYQESLQNQSFPITDARIISRAEAPMTASYPRSTRVMALGTVIGLMAGFGWAAMSELRDRVFRTADQVRDVLDMDFLGMLPIIESTKHSRDKKVEAGAISVAAAEKEDLLPEPVPQRTLEPLTIRDEMMRYVQRNPLSGYAETLRSAKIAADIRLQNDPSKVIGVLSALPAEGKTTTSKNLASLLASQGGRVLLIDADMRNPGLTRACAKSAVNGLVEVLTDGLDWRECLRSEPETGLHVLPGSVKRKISHTADLLASKRMQDLISDAGNSYDYIVLDMPPMGPVIDARAALPLLDAFVFVVEWGKTNRGMVRSILLEDPRVHEKALGVVLNKVDSKRLRMYDGYHSKHYYYRRYNKYYAQ